MLSLAGRRHEQVGRHDHLVDREPPADIHRKILEAADIGVEEGVVDPRAAACDAQTVVHQFLQRMQHPSPPVSGNVP
ncbi:MAG: hypothetical protein MUF63_17925 [Rhodobacteraceae bacterium]|nr:hypothetical protein [Paracoccaceae bacterium]